MVPLPLACPGLLDTPAFLLISRGLTELSGSAATPLRNFPHPPQNLFLPGIAVERLEAALTALAAPALCTGWL